MQEIIQHCVKARKPYVKARRTVAIMVLYLTGLRVTNLLNLTAKQLTDLLEEGHTEISLIKGGPNKHPLRLAYKGKKMMETIQDQVKTITRNKAYHDPAFSTHDDEKKAINQFPKEN